MQHKSSRFFCLLLASLCGQSVVVGSLSAQGPKPVVVARVIEKEINSGQKVVGTVHPLKRSTIGSAAEGRVKTFAVNQGQRVKKGDTMAQIRTETLKIEEAAAIAELELARQKLLELKNGARIEEKTEAKANMEVAKAANKNAQANLDRVKSLRLSNSASEQELEDAQARADVAKFTFIATDALYQQIKVGARKETVAQAEAQLELQQQKVNLIADRISKYKIVAPFDGFIAMEFTEEGAWIQRGDPVVELIQMDEIEIQAPVTAETAVNLRRGTVVRVEFPELPNELLTGTIDRIVPATSSRARTFPVHIKLENKIENDTPMLFAGMLARVDFPAGRREVLPLVPKDALVLNGKQRSVFVVDSNSGTGKVRKVDVELGVALDDLIQIRGDLQVNELVVVVGNERLTPGAEVKIIRESKTASAGE